MISLNWSISKKVHVACFLAINYNNCSYITAPLYIDIHDKEPIITKAIQS